MIIFVALLCVVSAVGVHLTRGKPLGKSATQAMNGIFVMLIFLSHSAPYLELDNGLLNTLYLLFKKLHDQLIVVPFLIFSGYGVMQQIKARRDYLVDFPRKRILKTLINFDVAVLIFAIVSIGLLGNRYTIGTVAFSFVGWTSVGNSNWYIFSVLLMYLASWLGGKFGNRQQIALFVTCFAAAYMLLFWKCFTYERWYYISTILCYPAGMWLSLYEDTIISKIRKYPLAVCIILCGLFLITAVKRSNMAVMNLHSVIFAGILIVFMTFITVENKVLLFLGKHSFSIYILQRLPMMVFSKTSIVEHYYLFVPVCLGITLLISLLFDYGMEKFWKMKLWTGHCDKNI